MEKKSMKYDRWVRILIMPSFIIFEAIYVGRLIALYHTDRYFFTMLNPNLVALGFSIVAEAGLGKKKAYAWWSFLILTSSSAAISIALFFLVLTRLGILAHPVWAVVFSLALTVVFSLNFGYYAKRRNMFQD